ncbi:MAG: 30S ribosomal protein S16 [Candidatus Dojkabacteria bacterium]|nr:MAG: 30S ribosomal protein S16 [Candidatus Dojkabacteria bacterium]
MVAIRLTRTGRKNYATYRIVAIDSRYARDSKAIEYLGSYNPHTKEILLKEDRIKYWLSVGAKPSDTVHRMLAKKGLIEPLPTKTFKKEPGKKSQERKQKSETNDVQEQKTEEVEASENANSQS